MSLLAILFQLIIGALIIGLVLWLVQQIPGLVPFANIIRVVAICLFVIYIIYLLYGILGGGPMIHLR